MKLKNNSLEQTILSVLMPSVFLFLVSSCKDDDGGAVISPTDPDIIEVAIEAGYTTLAAALTETDLVDDLQATGPFTIFAPTNAAFAADGITASNVGDVENLESILRYHVVTEKVILEDLTTGNLPTLYDETIAVDASALTLNGSVNIEMPFDVPASNGIIHSIDAVLTPPEPTIVDLASSNENLSVLVAALAKFPDLVELLDGEGNYTVFAPTNDGFTSLLGVIGQEELEDIPEDVLRRVLQYHIITGAEIRSGDLTDGQMAATALSPEDRVTVGVSGDEVTINGANLVTADLMGRNGIVHIVDAVLIPSLEMSIVNTIVESAYFDKDFSTLTAAVVKADLLGTLMAADANYTLFAPTNDAFEAAEITSLDELEAADLTRILRYHILSSEVFASELPSTQGAFATTISTLNGNFYLSNNTNGIFINGNSELTAATEAEGALDYDNGVVHVINRTLVPEQDHDIVAIAELAGFTDLSAALVEAGLVETLQADGPFTVFAPTNDAFQAAYTALGVTGPAELDDKLLSEILLYHVIGGARVFSSDLSDGISAVTLSTSQGEGTTNVTINIGERATVTDYDPEVADPTITSTDVLASNGVIHIIDSILLPDNTTL